MSLYIRNLEVPRVRITVYPKRRNDSYFNITLPEDMRRPPRTAGTGLPTGPSYADFFVAELARTTAPSVRAVA